MAKIRYDVELRCKDCQVTLYERHGLGGDDFGTAIVEARDIQHRRLPAGHAGHDVKLKGRAQKVVDTR